MFTGNCIHFVFQRIISRSPLFKRAVGVIDGCINRKALLEIQYEGEVSWILKCVMVWYILTAVMCRLTLMKENTRKVDMKIVLSLCRITWYRDKHLSSLMKTVITDRAGCPYLFQLLTIVLVFIIIIIIIIGRSTLSRTAYHESLNFLKMWSLVFFWYCTWRKQTMIFAKTIWWPEFGFKGFLAIFLILHHSCSLILHIMIVCNSV